MSVVRVRILPVVMLALVAALITGRAAHAAPFATNDDLAQYQLLPFSQPFTVFGNNNRATSEGAEPDHAGYPATSSVWYGWQPPYMNGMVTIDTLGSDFDTVIAVYNSCCLARYDTLVPVISNDNGEIDQTSSVTYEVQKDYPTFIAVDGVGGAQGNIQLNLRIDPFNDNFADATTITGTATSSPYWDHNTNATKEFGEPDHAGNPGGKSVWYSWTAPQTADVSMYTYDTEFDTLMAVYTDPPGGFPLVASNDDAPNPVNPGGSAVRFRAMGGTTYYIAIDGKDTGSGAASGLFNFYVQQSPVNDDFADAMLIAGTSIDRTDNNQYATSEPGEPDHSSFVFEPGSHSLWYRWVAPSAGCIFLDTTGSTTLEDPSSNTHVHTMVGVYTGTALTALTKVAESQQTYGHANFTFGVKSGVTYRIALDTFRTDPDFGREEGLLKLKMTSVPCPKLAIADASLNEGNSGTQGMSFAVTLSTPATQPVTFSWATSDGTATTPDYDALSGQVTLPAGQTSANVTVQIRGDTAPEPNETFKVTLTKPLNAQFADALGIGTIVNDDAATLGVGDVTVAEGNSGTTNASFDVTLSGPLSTTVTVGYSTANGTATSPGDYTAQSGTVTFAPGVTSRSVLIPVVGDTVTEPSETFTVNLSGPSGATISDGQGVGTITNDDTAVSLRINDVTRPEGASGTTGTTFAVTLSAAASQTVTVNWATANGTAVAPGDYQAASGTLTFVPGVVSQNVTVQVVGDAVPEPNERFLVNLSAPANATIADAQGAGNITNDDTPSLRISDVTVTEGNSGTAGAVFTLTLSGPVSQTVTVNWTTANSTAVAPSDYTAASGTVTFAPGATTRTVTVQVVGDLMVEPNERFFVNLSAPANATVTDAQGIGSIRNND